MKVLIVDDEALAQARLVRLLAEIPDVEVAGVCSHGLEAVEAIVRLRPDLVLLDIQMPGLDGFGVIEAVGVESMPPTLFVTAYDQHALRAFDCQALDYLLKPFEPERFHLAMERARRWIQGVPPPDLSGLMEQVRPEAGWLSRVVVREGESHRLLPTRSVQWIEAEDNYVRLHVDGTSYLLRQTMSGVLRRLDPNRFRRVHRSAIINLDHLEEVQRGVTGEHQVRMKDGTRLRLSRSFRECFGEWLLD